MVAAGTEARPTNFASFRVFHWNMDYCWERAFKTPDHEKVAAPCGPAVKTALTCLDSAKLTVILKIRCLSPM